MSIAKAIHVVVSRKSLGTNSDTAQKPLVWALYRATLHYFWRFSLRCYSTPNPADHATNTYPGDGVSNAVC